MTWAALCVTSESASTQKAIDLGGRACCFGSGSLVSGRCWRRSRPGCGGLRRLCKTRYSICAVTQLLAKSAAKVGDVAVADRGAGLGRVREPVLLAASSTGDRRAGPVARFSNRGTAGRAQSRIGPSFGPAPAPLVSAADRRSDLLVSSAGVVGIAPIGRGARVSLRRRKRLASQQEVAVYLQSLLRLIEARVPAPTALPAGWGFWVMLRS